MHFYDHRLTRLCKIPIQNHFGHKNFINSQFFKIFAVPIRTNLYQDFDMKIIFQSSSTQKFSEKKKKTISDERKLDLVT